MKIDAHRDERGYALIANFVNGFASGWRMAVPEVFREALDIKFYARRYAGKSEMLWTQGRLYGFREGDIIHDVKQAYERWDEALNHLRLSVQVQHAIPSSYVTYETIEIKADDQPLSISKGNTQEVLEPNESIIINKQRLYHGQITFNVYRPNREKSAIVLHETIECTQDDFVAFLQTGIIRTKSNKQIDLFA